MTLNIDNKGSISYEGQPFLWAAFYPKLKCEHKPVMIQAQQVPNPFTFDTGNGVAIYPAKSWLVFAADGSLTAVLDAEFQANWSIVST